MQLFQHKVSEHLVYVNFTAIAGHPHLRGYVVQAFRSMPTFRKKRNCCFLPQGINKVGLERTCTDRKQRIGNGMRAREYGELDGGPESGSIPTQRHLVPQKYRYLCIITHLVTSHETVTFMFNAVKI
jgi:hypothetical protein